MGVSNVGVLDGVRWVHGALLARVLKMRGMDTLRGVISMAWIAVHTTLWCVPLYLMGCVRLLIPPGRMRTGIGGLMDRIIDGWVASNRLLVWALRLSVIDARVSGVEKLARNGWYLVVSNHQSWVDIIVLQNTFLGRIPPLKFFTKRELIWVPLVGVAMWFLGFPYVRRYGRERLEQNPELAKHDRNATLKASRGFAERPTSVLSFLEGTRFTKAKHADQGSPYRHLLRPRPGGLSYVATALGDRANALVDVTIHYEGGVPGFWDFLCGRCRRIDVTVDTLAVPEPLTYTGSDRRDVLNRWVEELWRAKDRRVAETRAAE